MRDQELCVAAHLFAEEVNTESDLVGENLATKVDELYFQDLPIYMVSDRKGRAHGKARLRTISSGTNVKCGVVG